MFAPELWDAICSAVAEEYRSGKTLLSLAQTSQSVSSIAKRYIWYHVKNIRPLLECLPSDVWGPPASAKKFLRKPQSTDLEKLRGYAHLIRSYGPTHRFNTDHRDPCITHIVYERLQKAILPDECLLPNVRRVILDHRDTAYADLFLNRELRHLSVFFLHEDLDPTSGSPTPAAGLFRTIVTKSISNYLSLQELVLSPAEGQGEIDALSTSLCGFKGHLRRLEIGPVSPEAMTCIAKFSRLEILKLDLRACSVIDVKKPADHFDSSTFFPALHQLEIKSQSVSNCLSIIQLLPVGSPITKAQFECAKPRSYGWKQVVTLFSERCAPETLQAFSVGDRYMSSTHDEGGMDDIDETHIEPILKFRNLAQLDMDMYGAFHFSDELVERMATSWPKLHTLRFFTDESDAERKVTLVGIQALARHCHKLHLLTMCFDARLPEGGPPKLAQKSTCELGELNVIYSPIKDGHVVKAFLKDSFPDLERFSQWGEGYGGFPEWDVVAVELNLEEGGY